jgi:hypothetical protein
VGDAGDEERGRVVAGAGHRITDVGDSPVEVGDGLHVLPGDVLLAGEWCVVAVTFTGRRDESIDQDSIAVRAGMLLIDLGLGYLPQDRVQHLVVAGDRGLGTAEHLPDHIVGHVVPQPEQHRDHRGSQGQHVRATHRRLLLRTHHLPYPPDELRELFSGESCHSLGPGRPALDQLPRKDDLSDPGRRVR